MVGFCPVWPRLHFPSVFTVLVLRIIIIIIIGHNLLLFLVTVHLSFDYLLLPVHLLLFLLILSLYSHQQNSCHLSCPSSSPILPTSSSSCCTVTSKIPATFPVPLVLLYFQPHPLVVVQSPAKILPPFLSL